MQNMKHATGFIRSPAGLHYTLGETVERNKQFLLKVEIDRTEEKGKVNKRMIGSVTAGDFR